MGCGCGKNKNPPSDPPKPVIIPKAQVFSTENAFGRRMNSCQDCDLNKDGMCWYKLNVEKKTQEESKVENLAKDLYEACPIQEWDRELGVNPNETMYNHGKPVCEWCEAVIFFGNKTICDTCLERVKARAKSSFIDPYDVSMYESKFFAKSREPFPFTAEVKRDLHFFLWPKFASSTKYHIDQLKASIDLFNGDRICCVATDDTTLEKTYKDDLEEIFTEVYYIKNDSGKREAAGFVSTLEKMKLDDPNRVICFAHGKGQQPHTHQSETVLTWVEMMYETCVRNWEGVKHAMESGYHLAGSFKRNSGHIMGWHYSGSFFWARSMSIHEKQNWRNMKHHWWATESWAGRHWKEKEGYCLFADSFDGSMYDFKNAKVKDTPITQHLEDWRKTNNSKYKVDIPFYKESFPFKKDPIKNLHYFICPKHKESTDYHLSKIEQYSDDFNGKKICCIAKPNGVNIDAVVDRANNLFDVVYIRDNDQRKREGVGFVDSLKYLESNNRDEVICFAHAKGQMTKTAESEWVKRWNEALYYYTFENWEVIKEKFEDGFKAVGCFKSRNSQKHNHNRWHYQGSFWWARSAYLFLNKLWKDLRSNKYATQYYCGDRFIDQEAACLFGCDLESSLYEQEAWQEIDPFGLFSVGQI
tara:strand:- start:9441 stop:11363 length:1923 start_codon:yes stop_codon:yes gene_type:complete